MTSVSLKRIAFGVAVLLDSASMLHAQIGIGTWVKQSGKPEAAMTMTVEACCNGGRRLIYRIKTGIEMLLTVESPMNGTDVPVLMDGKPSGETMGIRRVDDRHTVAVLKMNGKTFGTSKGELSLDGKTLTVENEYTSDAGGQPVGKQTEIWVRK